MRADTWILHDLPERLVQDWEDGLIYTEADMQSAAHYWLRRHFEKWRSMSWSIRTEPPLPTPEGIRKPDLVLYKNATPYDFFELKCQLLGGFNSLRLEPDLEKLRALKPVYNVRHAYQFVLYDDDDIWRFAQKEPWMKTYVTFVGANVRRHPDSGYKRSSYDVSKSRWDRWRTPLNSGDR